MKLISLNTWGGRAGKELILDFFKKYKDTDIFCLQEVWNGGEDWDLDALGIGTEQEVAYRLLDEIAAILLDHKYFFHPHVAGHYGLAIFVKKDIEVLEEGEVFVHKEKGFLGEDHIGKHARNLQYVKLGGDNPITILNFHGLWNGMGKEDSEDRLIQSDKIVNFIKEIEIPYILAGDFNLLPNTESIKRIEALDVKNLIKDYGITSTRTSLYTKPLRFADYIFASNSIKVNDFRIMKEEVSDHSAMYLDFGSVDK